MTHTNIVNYQFNPHYYTYNIFLQYFRYRCQKKINAILAKYFKYCNVVNTISDYINKDLYNPIFDNIQHLLNYYDTQIKL